ncbi:hypothetical protein AZI87_13310 [Bdellovibrio bacteriovorus]|uniref:Uncharacterized protein n=1 Tax=Bdellovibrio bacteriovorus TaxID=959 RepID=A0A161QFI9_BDEBC|nr:hypothetical protein [Bdellovibrio bacteriovorus]KYG64215.1 hypothetical protein AZI87_13310 [Bdellovibrio bacteriovorus]
MKLLSSFMAVFIMTSFSFAGPGDGPIVPWPTSVVREALNETTIYGDWVAYEHNAVWYINIQKDPLEIGRASIAISSGAVFTHKAVGSLYRGDNVFWGKLVMDANHSAAIVLYKDYEGTKLRIAKGHNRYVDVKLYRQK